MAQLPVSDKRWPFGVRDVDHEQAVVGIVDERVVSGTLDAPHVVADAVERRCLDTRDECGMRGVGDAEDLQAVPAPVSRLALCGVRLSANARMVAGSDVDEAVADFDGLRFARTRRTEMPRLLGIRDINEFDAMQPAGHEHHISGDVDPRGDLDRIVVAQQPRFLRVHDVDDKDAVFARGDVGDLVFDLDLASRAEPIEHSQRLGLRRRGDVKHV
ncbi:MAG: hypothetical protein ABIP48_12750 [Planctomycetota bacterium]